MSIEAKIDELIAALDRNTAAHVGGASEPANKGGRKKAAAQDPAGAPANTATPASAPAAAAAPAAPATPVVPPPSIEKVNAAILALAKENRDKAVGVLAKFGVARSPELKPEQYQAVIDDAEEELAKVQAAAAQTSLV